MAYNGLSKNELNEILENAKKRYEEYKNKGLKLDLSRGKPCPEQLDLSMELLDNLKGPSCYMNNSGVDCRNYGDQSGIAEMKELFSEFLDVKPEQIFVAGNASLNLMFQVISIGYVKGFPNSLKPWNKYEKIKFLCPVPGYDRHFAITEYFNMELIAVPMLEDGPDVDFIENLTKDDETIKGMWCVPLYSNPDGCIYSENTIKRLANMRCAAADFTIMWDNAYIVHNLYGNDIKIINILDECDKAKNPNRAFVFTSTSKITFAGSGVSCVACSLENMKALLATTTISTIGYDKINMLRHVLFMKNRANVLELMKKHAEIMRPKFEIVDEILSKNLSMYDVAGWKKPEGGYFISLDVYEGTAKKVHAMCKDAGVVMTNPGATHPYGIDPKDKNIRIAPSYPTVSELKDACEILSLAVVITSIESILGA